MGAAGGWRCSRCSCVLSLWLTFRHLSKFGSAIPGTPGDSLLNLWIVTHVQDSVFHGWHALWNAPIFGPRFTRSPTASRCSWSRSSTGRCACCSGRSPRSTRCTSRATVLAAWCDLPVGHALHRGSDVARSVGALVYTLSAVEVTDFGHFQIVVGGALVPLVLLALVRCFDAPTPCRAARSSAWPCR